MYIGLDYGTSQCAVAAATPDGVAPIPLDAGQPFLISCLYAAERCLIGDFVAQSIQGVEQADFTQRRQASLKLAANAKRDLQIRHSREALLFGAEALRQHMSDPGEGYFIKSPKSFLGASGLRADMMDFFEDVVTAMMLVIKQRTERHLQQDITGAVIGRPVNFQGVNAETSNRQAQNILQTAARRVEGPCSRAERRSPGRTQPPARRRPRSVIRPTPGSGGASPVEPRQATGTARDAAAREVG